MLTTLVPFTHAQLSQGTILLGGEIRFDSRNSEDFDNTGALYDENKTTNFLVNVRGGYFVADDLAIGLLVGYDSRKNVMENPGTPPVLYRNTNQSSLFNIGLFARYYRMMGESRFALFGQLNATYGMGETSSEDMNVNAGGVTVSSKSRGEHNVMDVSAAPGITFFFSDRIALEATFGRIGYTVENRDNFNSAGDQVSNQKTSGFNLSLNPSNVTFGITFFLGGGGSAPATK